MEDTARVRPSGAGLAAGAEGGRVRRGSHVNAARRCGHHADAHLAVSGVEDVVAVPGAAHPGSYDRSRRAEAAPSPGDVLRDRPAVRAVQVAGSPDARCHVDAARRGVAEVAATDHVASVAARGAREARVDPQPRHAAARPSRTVGAWRGTAEAAAAATWQFGRMPRTIALALAGVRTSAQQTTAVARIAERLVFWAMLHGSSDRAVGFSPDRQRTQCACGGSRRLPQEA